MANHEPVDPQTGLDDEERDALYWKQRLNRIRYGLDLMRTKETPPVGPYAQLMEDWGPVIRWQATKDNPPEEVEPWD